VRRRGRPRHPDILTPRQWEVLALARRGFSNREIGGRLGMTYARTAKYNRLLRIEEELGAPARYAGRAALRR